MKFTTSKHVSYFVIGIFLIYHLPYLLLGTGGSYRIHDNLDGVISTYKIINDEQQLFASNSSIIKNALGGLPRSSFPSEFEFYNVLHQLFGPFGAYIFNRLIQSIVGIIGMYLLLQNFLFDSSEDKKWISAGSSLCFGLLPFWPLGQLSLAGLPLLLFSFLQIRINRANYYCWAFIFFFPFISNIALIGVFVIMVLGLLMLYDWIHKEFNLKYLLAFTGLVFFYVFVYYRLFLVFLLDNDYVSHRVEFQVHPIQGFPTSWDKFMDNFFIGQIHAYSLHNWIIIPTIIIGLVALWHWRSQSFKIVCLIVTAIVIISFLYGFINWYRLAPIKSLITDIVPIQIDRIHWFHPVLWHIAFAISLGAIAQYLRKGDLIAVGIIGLQLFYTLLWHELYFNRHLPSWKSFFAVEQFNEIKGFIGDDIENSRVASIGIQPAIALYNDLHTLDGYFSDYPLSYKRDFRVVMEKELAKTERMANYYDKWGSRCYLWTSTLEKKQHPKGNEVVVKDLELNFDKFLELGGRYIISTVKIDIGHPRLHFQKKFEHIESNWDIYLYKIGV